MSTGAWRVGAIIVSTILLACGETSRNRRNTDATPTNSQGAGGTVSTTPTSGSGTTRPGSGSSTTGIGGSGGSVGGSAGTLAVAGSGGIGEGGTGNAAPISCTCGELEGTCHYRLEDFCFGLDCEEPGLLATQRGAAAFCDGDASQTMSYCEDGTYRFQRSWGAGENAALLVFSSGTDELVYGAASGYLDTPCGSEGIDAYAGTAPIETSCVSCVICEYGEELADNGDVLSGAAGAAGAGGEASRCPWSDEGVPLIP